MTQHDDGGPAHPLQPMMEEGQRDLVHHRALLREMLLAGLRADPRMGARNIVCAAHAIAKTRCREASDE